MSRLLALYPQTWRDRYQVEFLALLSERPPGRLDRLDILRGAIDARLHPQVQGSPPAPETPVVGSSWPVRAGWLTLLGGVLWIATLVVAVNAPIVVDTSGTYRDVAAASPLFLAAVMLLGVGLIATFAQLPEPSRPVQTAVYVGSLAGLLWAFAPWLMYAGMVAFVGLLVVAVAARRAGRWSSLELGALVTGVGLGWVLLLTGASGLWGPSTPNPDLQYLVLAVFVSAWFVVGASLVRAPGYAVSLAPPDA